MAETLTNPHPYPANGPMSVTVEPYKTAVIVHLDEMLDFSNTGAFKAVCFDQLRLGTRHLVIDFSNTGILDSTGLGAIFALYRELKRLEGQVVFASLSTPVRVVIQISRIQQVFPSYKSVEAACEAVC